MTAARNAYLVCAFTLVASLFASAEEKTWVEVRSPHFRVLTDGSDNDARRIAREFEQMRTVFAGTSLNLRLDSGAPLLVFASRDAASMEALAPQRWKRRSAKRIGGYFQHGWEKKFAVVRLDEVAPDAYEVVYHEYVHSLLHMNFRWLPLWLDEGLAGFFSNTRFEQSRVLLGAPNWRMLDTLRGPPSLRIGTVRAKPMIPLETLFAVNRSSAYYQEQDKVPMFYAESWVLTHFLTYGAGMDQGKKINEFCRILQEGVDDKKAFQQVFGDLKQVENNLDKYVHNFPTSEWGFKKTVQVDEKSFVVRALSVAETEAELGGYDLWSHDIADARVLIDKALKDDPKLGLAHENKGFLEFANGRDTDAAREFGQAYEVDRTSYLSLFFKTMLSPIARSDLPRDQTNFHDALLKTLEINPEFAPAYVQLARLYIRQGNLAHALGVARKAEQLEPSRAGYHLLSGHILLRMGHGAEAAAFAKYVAERWYGADRDEAIELWNSVPAAQRPAGDPPSETGPQGTQAVEGRIKSAACSESGPGLIVVDAHGQLFSFPMQGHWRGGFSDTVWYGADHVSFCHHVEGMRVVVRYKSSSEKSYTGELTELDLREDLPAAIAVLKRPD